MKRGARYLNYSDADSGLWAVYDAPGMGFGAFCFDPVIVKKG